MGTITHPAPRGRRATVTLLESLYAEFKLLVAQLERLRTIEVRAREALEAAQDREWSGGPAGKVDPAMKAWSSAYENWTRIRLAIAQNQLSRQRELMRQQEPK